jgi:hypothetical protein
MVESDFGKKTSAAETGTHHGKQHRTSFGKTTSRRSSHQRTRATHHSKNRHQKGTTFMKSKASATALVLFIVTLLFVGGESTKAATFSTGDTFGGNVTLTTSTSRGVTKDTRTQFIQSGIKNTLDGSILATATGGQSSVWNISNAVTACSKQKWITLLNGGTATTRTASTGQVGGTVKFTTQQGNYTDVTFTESNGFFDDTDKNFNQVF